ncbi:hypothetical protein [Achromobacter sp.]|jgi:hypothetical protein
MAGDPFVDARIRQSVKAQNRIVEVRKNTNVLLRFCRKTQMRIY